MAAQPNSTNFEIGPGSPIDLAIPNLNWMELLAVYAIVHSAAEAIGGRMAQPRVTDKVEDLLQGLMQSLENVTQAVVTEATNRPCDRSMDADYKM